jgi:multidrug efflux system membrane fusion protein
MLRSMKNLLQRVNRGRFNRVAGLVSLIGASALFSLSGCAPPADAQGGPPHAPPVSVAPAVQRSVSDSEEFSGRLEAIDFVELRPRVSGTIDKVHFVDGALVRKGDLLFTIDPRPFEAEQARAQSQLASTKAKSELAQSELARARTLLAQQAASKEEVDQLNSTSRTSQADIQGAEAALRVASLNLGYTQVRAPIAGRVSRALITAGNLVNEQSVLTSIAGVGRVYAYFDGSEQTYLQLRALKADAKAPRVVMGLANETNYPHVGQLDFVDNRLNPQTGAIRLRASFDNAKGQFTPGLAARLRMESPTAYDAVMVPDRAIGTDQSKKFVFVVAADGKPQFREVKPGALFDGMRVVQGNLKAGENVVVDGLQRIQPGMTVAPQVLKVDAQGMPIFPPPPGPAGSAPASKG